MKFLLFQVLYYIAKSPVEDIKNIKEDCITGCGSLKEKKKRKEKRGKTKNKRWHLTSGSGGLGNIT